MATLIRVFYLLICFTIALPFPAGSADRAFISRDKSNSTLAIFVHGFTGSYLETWGDLPSLLSSDPGLAEYGFLFWGYPTKLFGADEDIGTIGKYLKTEIDYLPEGKYKDVVLIAHSMGGLVVRSYIIQALIDLKGDDLSNIRRVIFFGVPNEGLKKAGLVPSLVNRQIADMDTASDLIVELRKYWVQRVISATEDNAFMRRISTTAVVGLEDDFVPVYTAKSFFENTAVTDGDHVSMVKPKTRQDLTYRIISRALRDITREHRRTNEPKFVTESAKAVGPSEPKYELRAAAPDPEPEAETDLAIIRERRKTVVTVDFTLWNPHPHAKVRVHGIQVEQIFRYDTIAFCCPEERSDVSFTVDMASSRAKIADAPSSITYEIPPLSSHAFAAEVIVLPGVPDRAPRLGLGIKITYSTPEGKIFDVKSDKVYVVNPYGQSPNVAYDLETLKKLLPVTLSEASAWFLPESSPREALRP